MKTKVLKVAVTLLIIAFMILSDFVLVGRSIVLAISEGLSESGTTNCSNVEFDTYFKNQDGQKVKEKEIAVDTDETLYVEIEVKKEGYINGTLEFKDKNFELKDDILSDKVSKIEGNTISLNQINAGEKVEIPLNIKTKKTDNIELSFLSLESEMYLKGIYKDSTEKDINVEGTRAVQAKLVSKNKEISLTGEVITNQVNSVDNTNKTIAQVMINTGLKENDYPIKNNKLEIQIPNYEKVEKVTVIGMDVNIPITDENYEFNKEEGNIVIQIPNNETEGKVKWQNKLDKLLITIQYQEAIDITKENIQIKNEIQLYDENTSTLQQEIQLAIGEEKNGFITYETQNTVNEIYKGKIETGETKQFEKITNIYINEVGIQNSYQVKELQEKYQVGNEQFNVNSKYINTQINKQELDNLLGENGVLKILKTSGETITEINKETQANEQGNIVINYQEELGGIVLYFVQVEKQGKVSIKQTKQIQEEADNIIVQNATQIVETLEGISGSKQIQIALKEAIEQASIEVMPNSLTTLEKNENIEIRATMKTNEESQKLYKNPVIQIELPDVIENIEFKSIQLLYEEELIIKSAKMKTENGKRIVEIQMEGEQTKHKEGDIQNAIISIIADITVKVEAGNQTLPTKMSVSNEDRILETSTDIQICTLENVVTTNNIEEYQIKTSGKEKEEKAIIKDEMQGTGTKVELGIINNEKTSVENVNVLGRFPTLGKAKIGDQELENTLPIQINRNIELSGIDSSQVKIYYSEKEEVTADVTNSENEWKEQIENPTEVKNYLIQMNGLEQGQQVVASYNIQVPNSLSANQVSYEGYEVSYKVDSVIEPKTSTSTVVALETEPKAQIEANVTALVGQDELKDGDKVKEGETIKYTVEFKNTGNLEAQNVSAKVKIPENTVYVIPYEGEYGYEYTGDVYYEEKADTELTYDIETLGIGESITKEYEVRVKQDTEGSTISNTVEFTYEDNTIKSNTISNTIEKGDLRVSAKQVSDRTTDFVEGNTINYYVIVENMTSEAQENVTVRLNIPQGAEIYALILKKFEGEEVTQSEEIDKNLEANIGTLEPNERKVLEVVVEVLDIDDSAFKFTAVAKSDTQEWCRSNLYQSTVALADMEATMTCDNTNEKVYAGDRFKYIIQINNKGQANADFVQLIDNIPEQLNVISITINGEVVEQATTDEEGLPTYLDNNIDRTFSLEKDGTIIIEIEVEVQNFELEQYTEIINEATVTSSGFEATLGPIKHIYAMEIGDDDDIEIPEEDNGTYAISGTAWLDSDEDGEKDTNEEIMKDINVMLLDANTGEVIKDDQGQKITAKTDELGFYQFNEIKNGRYLVVFEYDTNRYKITTYKAENADNTKTSKAISKELNVDGVQKTYGVTDIVTIDGEDTRYINIGFIELEIFNLQIQKTVNRITVNYQSGIQVYEFNNTTMAKVELEAKKLNNAVVTIEYHLTIENTGEVPGYATSIVDDIPAGLNFDASLNNNWNLEDGKVYNESISNEIIEPGQEKTLTLVLTKTMTEDNTGLISNTAGIEQSYNEIGIPENGGTDDNQAMADVILSIRTGTVYLYIALIITMLAIISVGIYLIYKKVLTNK